MNLSIDGLPDSHNITNGVWAGPGPRAGLVTVALMVALTIVVLLGLVSSAMASFYMVRCALPGKIRVFCVAIVLCDFAILASSYLGTYVLSDALYVWTGGRFYFSLHLTAQWFCKLRSYLFFTMQFCSNYIVLLLAIERYIAVHRPFLAQRFGIGLTWAGIATIVVVAHVYHVWCYRVSGLVKRWDETGKKCMPDIDTLEGLVAFVVFAQLDCILPSCISAILNILVAIKVWKCFKVRQRMCSMPSKPRRATLSDTAGPNKTLETSERNSNSLSNRELRTTLTLVVCSLVQCALHATAALSWLVFSFHYYANALDADHNFATQLTYSSRLTLALGCVPHVVKPLLILKRALLFRSEVLRARRTSLHSFSNVCVNETRRRILIPEYSNQD